MWILERIRLQPVTILTILTPWQREAFLSLKTPKPGDECQALQNPVHQQAQLLPCVALWRLGGEAGDDDYSVHNLALLPTGWVWQSSSLEDLQCQLPAPAKVRVLEQPVWGVHWHHGQSFGVSAPYQLSSAWLQVLDLVFLQVKFQTLHSSTFLYSSHCLQTFHPNLLEISCSSSWEICRCVSDFPAFSPSFALPLLLFPRSTLVVVFLHHLTSISLSWEEPHLHLS